MHEMFLRRRKCRNLRRLFGHAQLPFLTLASTPRPFDGNTILNGEKSICMIIELPNTAVFERRKSYVRSYCLSVDPYIAPDGDIARGSSTPDVDGGEYIDFPHAADSLDNGKQPKPAVRPHRIPDARRHQDRPRQCGTTTDRPAIEPEAMVTIDVSTGHLIAAGRYRRIPAGHDAPGIASGDARRRKRTPIEYQIRDGVTHCYASAKRQRTALLWIRRPR